MEALAIGRIVSERLARVPAWVRSELSAKDAAVRERAEETLAALIAAALTADGGASDDRS